MRVYSAHLQMNVAYRDVKLLLHHYCSYQYTIDKFGEKVNSKTNF